MIRISLRGIKCGKLMFCNCHVKGFLIGLTGLDVAISSKFIAISEKHPNIRGATGIFRGKTEVAKYAQLKAGCGGSISQKGGRRELRNTPNPKPTLLTG